MEEPRHSIPPRSHFAEIHEEYLVVLAEIVTSLTDSEMRARVADILWIRKKATYPIIKCAIEAYLEIAHKEENPDNWIERI